VKFCLPREALTFSFVRFFLTTLPLIPPSTPSSSVIRFRSCTRPQLEQTIRPSSSSNSVQPQFGHASSSSMFPDRVKRQSFHRRCDAGRKSSVLKCFKMRVLRACRNCHKHRQTSKYFWAKKQIRGCRHEYRRVPATEEWNLTNGRSPVYDSKKNWTGL
jgi:hypothetical protein